MVKVKLMFAFWARIFAGHYENDVHREFGAIRKLRAEDKHELDHSAVYSLLSSK